MLALGRKGLDAFGGLDEAAQLLLFFVEVDAIDEPLDGVGAHATFEVVGEAHGELAPQQLVFDDLTGEEAAELVERATENVDLLVEALTDRHEVALARALDGP